MNSKEIDNNFKKLMTDLDHLRFKNINEDDDIDSIQDKFSLVESDIESLRKYLSDGYKYVKQLNNDKSEPAELLKNIIKNLKVYQLQYKKIEKLIHSGVIYSKERILDAFESVSADLDAILKLIDPQLEKTSQINLDIDELDEEFSTSSEDLQSSAEFSSSDQEEGNPEISLDQLLKNNIAESSALLSKVSNLIKTIKKSDEADLHALFNKLNRKVGTLLKVNEKNNTVLNKYFSVADSTKNTDSMVRILSEINNEIALLCSDTIPDMIHKAKQEPKKLTKVQSVIKDSVKRLSGKLARKSSKSWVDESRDKASAEKTKSESSAVNSLNKEKSGGKKEL